MENKVNKNPQSNQNPTAQSSSQGNTSTIGSASQSSIAGSSSNQSSIKSSSARSQSSTSGRSGSEKSNWMDTFKKENLNNLTGKLQEFGNSTVEKAKNLTTTQKVVGGSLLALGAGWVAMNSMNKNKSSMSSKHTASAQNKLNKNLKKNR